MLSRFGILNSRRRRGLRSRADAPFSARRQPRVSPSPAPASAPGDLDRAAGESRAALRRAAADPRGPGAEPRRRTRRGSAPRPAVLRARGPGRRATRGERRRSRPRSTGRARTRHPGRPVRVLAAGTAAVGARSRSAATAGPVLATTSVRPAGYAVDPYAHVPSVRDVVPDRVLDQVRRQTSDEAPVAREDRRLQRARRTRNPRARASASLVLATPRGRSPPGRSARGGRSRAGRGRARAARRSAAPAARLLEHLPAGRAKRVDGRVRDRYTPSRAALRAAVSGVRSSCDALATNRRWASNAASRRSSSPSIVSASSRSSSRGPHRAPAAGCRLASEIWWVVAVIVRSGRSTRPATSQPSRAEITRHDRQRDARLDDQLVQVRDPLLGADGHDRPASKIDPSSLRTGAARVIPGSP